MPLSPFVPIRDALADLGFGGAGLEAEEGYRGSCCRRCCAAAGVVGLGFAFLATSFACLALWCMCKGMGPMLSKNLE